MSDTTKLILSDGELRFVQDTEWVLTKRRITDTVNAIFNEQVDVISGSMRAAIIAIDPALVTVHPKISKGENYRLLPYVILDYPAVFSKDKVFALRTMFWWGNFMSITLHLSGEYAASLGERIQQKLAADPGDFYVCINTEEWEHYFDATNYRQAATTSPQQMQEMLKQSSFIKLALKYDLTQWPVLPGLLKEGYEKIARLLAG